MNSLLWLLAFVGFAIGEALTIGLICIWFGIGCLGAMVAALLGFGTLTQWVVFAITTLVFIIVCRPITMKYVKARVQPTNADRVIGATAVVTEEINNVAASGEVKIFGQAWSARNETEEIIPVGAEVKVLRIEGVKLFVQTI